MPSRFQPTRWSLIRNAASSEIRMRDQAWTEFDYLYRDPLLRFICRSGWPMDRAEDLLQSFLTVVVKRNWLAEADPAQGKMRTFLLSRLKWHLNDVRKSDRAEKRGGGAEMVSLDAENDAAANLVHTGSSGTAEREFDRAWAQAILEHTLTGLEQRAEAKGNGRIFHLLKGQITGDSEEKLAEVAGELGLSLGAVRMKLQRLREDFRNRLRSNVAETLMPDQDLAEEMRYLAKVLSD